VNQAVLWTLCACLGLVAVTGATAQSEADRAFERLAQRYVDGFPRFSPAGATQLGDHRFDGELDRITAETRARRAAFTRECRSTLDEIDRGALSRQHQVDHALLSHALAAELFELEELQSWAWDPLVYTQLVGGAIYGLMARDFAPLPERMGNVGDRLRALPRLLEEVRGTLEPERVPRVHAETAVRQNRGVLSIISEMVQPQMDRLDEDQRASLTRAIDAATSAVERHQRWLESELLTAAKGDFRIGCELYDKKLAFSLHTPMSRSQLRDRAQSEYRRVRDEMYRVSREIYEGRYPWVEFPGEPDESYKQAIIRAALEVAYLDLPGKDLIVETAKAQLRQAAAFVRDEELMTLPDDPVDVIVMPEFQRGVSIAYCDAPGPLDSGLKTFYAVSPIPEDWTEEQVASFLREYNLWSLQDLTIHEGIPGHYVQLALANRYPSTLRAVLASGTFIEGWAVYAEQMMADAGYNGSDPRQKLIALKWLLRSVTNALIDQAIHCDGMTREQAMRLMVEGGFQEEREAALKWTRAQLTSTQLATYLVGYLEHVDLRQAVEQAWGDRFSPRRYHDTVLSFGSPPVQFVRALVLDEPIP
jgi:uncharacterized protein (DUF885 family)